MPESKELVRLDPQSLIRAAVDKGADVDVLERLVALAKDVRRETARDAWYSAMAEFQRTCPAILKDKQAQIRTRTGGNFGYRYASLDTVLAVVLPVMGPLGLSVSFKHGCDAEFVHATCVVSHALGHSETSGEMRIPIGKAGVDGGASAQQMVGIASTYAKRYALLAILGLSPEDDTDGDTNGAPPAVATPTRKSAPVEHPVSRPGDKEWRGFIDSVTTRTGETKGKRWTIYDIKGSDGAEFGTFSETVAAAAREAFESGVEVIVTWTETAKGNKNAESVRHAEEHG